MNWTSPAEVQGLTQAAQIRQTLQAQIDAGLLLPGSRLPSERELSERFATTRITLKEALAALEAEGQIYREERRGWFVATPRFVYDPRYKSHFHAMVEAQQRQIETRVLHAGSVLATPAQCRQLALPPLSNLLRIGRVRQIDARNVVYVEHFLLPARFPDLLSHDLSQSLTRLYADHYGIRYGRAQFDIVSSAARGTVARALNLADGAPVLLITRINYDEQGALIDCDCEYWRHDAVVIRIDSHDSWMDQSGLIKPD